jgi:pimeloyl-ACP methyl ester carboxylesterase
MWPILVACVAAVGLLVYLVQAARQRRHAIMEENATMFADIPRAQNLLAIFAHGHGSSPVVGGLYANAQLAYTADGSPHGKRFVDDVYDAFYRYIAMPNLSPTFTLFPCIHAPSTASGISRYNMGGRDDALWYIASFMGLHIDEIPLAFIGHSRGCSTVINALAHLPTRNEWPEYKSRVRAVILLNPFASFQDAVAHHYLVPRFLAPLILWLYKNVASYNPNYDPINVFPRLPRDLNYYVAYAKNDPIVPASSTKRLIKAMVDVGLDVRVLEMDTDQHNFAFASRDERLKLFKFLCAATF